MQRPHLLTFILLLFLIAGCGGGDEGGSTGGASGGASSGGSSSSSGGGGDGMEEVPIALSRLLKANRLKGDDESKILAAVKKLGRPNLEILASAIRTGDDTERKAATAKLAKGETAESAAYLTAWVLLSPACPGPKRTAATMRMLGSASVPALLHVLRRGNMRQRKLAVETMAEIRDARAVEGLLDALKDKTGIVRVPVISALGKFPEYADHWTKPVFEQIRYGDSTVKETARAVLAKGPKTVEFLRGVLKSDGSMLSFEPQLDAIGVIKKMSRAHINELLPDVAPYLAQPRTGSATLGVFRRSGIPGLKALLSVLERTPQPERAIREAIIRLMTAKWPKPGPDVHQRIEALIPKEPEELLQKMLKDALRSLGGRRIR